LQSERTVIRNTYSENFFTEILVNLNFSWFWFNIIMAFCYHFKLRIPHPKDFSTKLGSKKINFKMLVPFKSRRFSGGRFGYSTLEEDTKFIAKALKFLKNRSYSHL